MADRRPALEIIAREAGVSLATVDRALNGRSGVRAETRARIEQVASRLGYPTSPNATLVSRRHGLKLSFLLPPPSNSFFRHLHASARQTAEWLATEGVDTRIQEIPRLNAATIAEAIAAAAKTSDGIAVVALDDPQVRLAIDSAEVPVVTLVSDCPGSRRAGFSGIDNVASGRTAGFLVSRFLSGRTGKIATIVGLQRVRDHVERVLGLRQALEPGLTVLPLEPEAEEGDMSQANYRVLRRALETDPEIIGIYNVGAGNQGVVSAIRDCGAAGKTVFIGHELTDLTRQALLDGTMSAAISQDSSHEMRSAVRQLFSHITNEQLIPGQERIRIEIYIRENLP